MTRPAIIQLDGAMTAAHLRHLEASGPVPAWLIDIPAGRVLAATAEGAARLGLPAVSPPMLLDAASPALVRLRTLAASAAGRTASEDATACEPLVFWTPVGAVRAVCRIRLLNAGGRGLAVVVAQGDVEAPERAHAARGTGTGPPTAAPESALPSDLRRRLAHELRTPVSALTAAAEIMKNEHFGPLGSPRYVGYATDIHAAARHVLGVIDRMLAEAGAGPGVSTLALDFTQIDTGALVTSAASQIAPLAERAGIALTLDLAPRLPHVIADATSLRQILFNLMTNALKFTPRGGCVTVSARSGDGGALVIAISDTGRGMSRREIDALLGRGGAEGTDPASQHPAEAAGEAVSGPASQGGAGRGLGIGLPLVQALAAANGAALSLDSAPGTGTSAALLFRKDRVVPV